MQTLTVQQAQDRLRGGDVRRVRVRYRGKNRTLFYNSRMQAFGMLLPGSRKSGYIFNDWAGLEKIQVPSSLSPEEENSRLVEKYRKKASLATWDNNWLRKIRSADASLSLFENGITTSSEVDGKVITLASVEKSNYYCAATFREALEKRKPYHSYRFPFRGYEATLWVEPDEGSGDLCAGLSLEYKGCANGYYYLLANRNEFLGYDKD